MPLGRPIRRFFALSSADRALLIRAYVDLGRMDVSLRVTKFQGVVERAERSPVKPVEQVTEADVGRATHYARLIEIAARHHVVRARCLQRALVLHRWLRDERLPSSLRIGVRKESGGLTAHAWVELAARVVAEPEDVPLKFAPLG